MLSFDQIDTICKRNTGEYFLSNFKKGYFDLNMKCDIDIDSVILLWMPLSKNSEEWSKIVIEVSSVCLETELISSLG